MELWIGLDPEQFAARIGTFLEDGVQRNLVATIFAAVRTGRWSETIFAVATDADGRTTGVALRTPPHNIVAAGEFADPDALIAGWIGLDPAPPGVVGESTLANALGDAWRRTTRGRVELQTSEALHLLTELTPPEREVAGALSRADFRQAAQMGEWGVAFAIDAGLPHPDQVAAGIEHQLEGERLYVWEVDGASVALVGHNIEIAGTVRIGPVYTPPAQRGKGYATAATAAVSRLLLDAGAERCILYTDLANPISNHVYAKIGYVPIGAQSVLAFERPADGPGAA